MALTEFTPEQTEEIKSAKELILQASAKLKSVDDQLYKLGSFPESPISHTQWDLENTAIYLQTWLHDGGVEII